MVGGGRDAFIGAVHRKAIALDGQVELVAGALSSSAGEGAGLGARPGPGRRPQPRRLAGAARRRAEAPADERIDFVSIVTPNHVHFPVAQAFVDAGFHVVCDKPLVHTREQADALVAAVARQGTVFGVTYNYTGYPMVRQAREMVRAGELGDDPQGRRRIQPGLARHARSKAKATSRPLAQRPGAQRRRPAPSATSARMPRTWSRASPGSRSRACAPTWLAGARAARSTTTAACCCAFDGGARGVLVASQINTGLENDLRLRVSGTLGTLEWRQEQPSQLVHLPHDGAEAHPHARLALAQRGGAAREPAAERAIPEASSRPSPMSIAASPPTSAPASRASAADPLAADYPRVEDGARGVRFIERTVASAQPARPKWTAW